MKDFGEFANRVMEILATLPPQERHDAILEILSDMIKAMPVESILEMRVEILSQFDEKIPIIQATIDLIDGHLAIRDMGKFDV